MQNAVGIRLIRLKTAIAILACKLHIRNIRGDTRIAKLIRMSKEAVKVKHRVRQNTNKERVSRNPITQVEEVQEIMRSRDLQSDQSRINHYKEYNNNGLYQEVY